MQNTRMANTSVRTTSAGESAFRPPAPVPRSPVVSLLRVILQGEGNLLSLLPSVAYHDDVARLGYSRRDIVVVNEPQWVRRILANEDGIFPKNDLMVEALDPLVGNSMFVSDGDTWQRQRAMIDPALTSMRVNRAFASMSDAIDDYQQRLDKAAQDRTTISLDLAMSHLTADIICRSVFSTSLESSTARDVFEDFKLFERSVAQVKLWRLIATPAFTPAKQEQKVLDACQRIRAHLGQLVDAHLAASNTGQFNDIASQLIAARSPDTHAPFNRKELIDQLGVFFLAGHETTASVLTWVLYILATRPDIAKGVRDEVRRVAGDNAIAFEQVRELRYVRHVFREALRLYPPITFLPRVAMERTQIGQFPIKRGAMIMVSPWTIHRHRKLWKHPEHFDPDRFSNAREQELTQGAYLPFGVGPRVCAGAGFAMVESALIIASLARRYDFTALNPETVQPVARLTTRPSRQIMAHVQRC